MSPVSPANGRSFTLQELHKKLVCTSVSVVNLGNYWLAYDAYSYKGLRFNKVATAWCEAIGNDSEVRGSAILIEKDSWKY